MTKMKKTALAFGTACALAFGGGFAALNVFPANAEAKASGDRKFYGAQLSNNEIAGAFYDELVAMTVDPDGNGAELSAFRKGESHTVTSQAILDEAAAYEAGSMNLVKQFGAALDSFRYDYNELFYVDFDLLNFTVTKTVQTPDPGEGEEETQADDAETGNAQYAVTIGAGRATSYFLYDLTAEELNGKDGADGLFANYTAAKATFKQAVDTALGGGTSVKEKAIAVNKVISEKFRYGFDFNSDGNVNGVDRFVATTASIVPSSATAKCYANGEGLARVYKMLMNELGVSCELVSGYYVSGGSVGAGMWNYVKDSSDYYAVDVTNNLSTDNKYLWLSGETFSLDHFENRIVSRSNYKLTYPTLLVNKYNVETGELQIANGTYEGREGIAVSYTGNGGKLAFRTKGEDGVWSAWTTFEDYMLTDGPEAEVPAPEALAEEGEGGETTPPATDGEGEEPTDPVDPGTDPEDPDPTDPEEPDPVEPEPTYNIAEKDGVYYLFSLTEGAFQIGVLDSNNKCVEYGETVKEELEDIVPLPIGANPERAEAQDIAHPFDVEITYLVDLKKTDNALPVEVEYTVSSVNGSFVSEEFVKQFCKIENVDFNTGTSTLKFKFTPSALLAHNGLRYSFTPTNVESVETGAKPQAYSVVFKFDGIKATGVYDGSNYYADVVSMPSLVYNNNISLDGWKYYPVEGGTAVSVTENMRSTLALSVTKPVGTVDTALTEAVKAKIDASTNLFKPGAYLASENYLTALTVDGKTASIPAGSYLDLTFPYPNGYGPDHANAVYRVLQFGLDAQGNVNYEDVQIIEAIGLRQGIVASVNSFSAFALVAVDGAKVVCPYGDNYIQKTVYTMTTGVGGKVSVKVNSNGSYSTESDKTVNAAQRIDKIIYTIKPDEGYIIDSVTLNGIDVSGKVTNGVYTLDYGDTDFLLNTVSSPINILQVSFKPADAEAGANAVENAAMNAFAKMQLSKTAYTEDEKNEIIKDYPSGGANYVPEVPPVEEPFNPASTTMQLIIVAGVVGAFVVIGAIVIIYCGAIKPKIVREREEEAARIAANRERRANRNRMQPMGGGMPRDPKNPMGK